MLMTKIRADVADYAAHKQTIHKIRHDVFVVEQNVPQTLEIDGVDPSAIHVLAHCYGQAAGTGRLDINGKIGRIAVYPQLRRQGVGWEIMQCLMAVAHRQGHQQVVLSAQCHAIAFYQKLGFQTMGGVYQEVGIDHIKMVKRLT